MKSDGGSQACSTQTPAQRRNLFVVASCFTLLVTLFATQAGAQQYQLTVPFEQYEPDYMVNVEVRFPKRFVADNLAFRLFGPEIAPAGHPIECDFNPYYIDSGIGPAVTAPRTPGRYEIRLLKGAKLLASTGFTVIQPSMTNELESPDAARVSSAAPSVATQSDLKSIPESRARLTAYRDHILARLQEMDDMYYGSDVATETLRKLRGGQQHQVDGSHNHFLRWDWNGPPRRYYEGHAKALTDSLAIAERRGGIDVAWMNVVDSGMTCWDNHELTIRQVFFKYAEMWASQTTWQGDSWERLKADFRIDQLGIQKCFTAMPDRPPTFAPASMARLRFVLPAESDYIEIPDGVVHHGDEFHLQAEFEAPPEKCGQSVELELSKGVREQIPLVRASENPRICRSALLRVENPDL